MVERGPAARFEERRHRAVAPALSHHRRPAQQGAPAGAALRLRFRRRRRHRGILHQAQHRRVPGDRADAALLHRGQGQHRGRAVRAQICGADRRRADGLRRPDVAGRREDVRRRGAEAEHSLTCWRRRATPRSRRSRRSRPTCSGSSSTASRTTITPSPSTSCAAPTRPARMCWCRPWTRPASRSGRATSATAPACRSRSIRGRPIRC